MLLEKEIIGATTAGVVTTVVGHPLDTLKVHLQTTASSHNVSTWQMASRLFQERLLFRGMLPPLANAIIMNTVMFGAFQSVKKACGEVDDPYHSLAAGLVSGFATACISTPTDYFKIQAQLGKTTACTNSMSRCFSKLMQYNPQSITRVFRGHTVNLGREGVFTMVYLGLYDQVQPQGLFEVALTSSLTGALAWVSSYPLDTIKSVVQGGGRHARGIRQAATSIYKRGGLSAFYRGCLSSTGRAILVTSLRMITYEQVCQMIQ